MDASDKTETEHEPLDLSSSERRRLMRRAVIGQCLGMPLWFCLVTGGLATMYALNLGAGDLSVGLINAALFLGAGMLPFVPVVMKRRDTRGVILVFWTLSGVAALPLLFIPEFQAWLGSRGALVAMGASCMFYAGFYGAGVGAWTSFFRDTVPERVSRRFLGVLRMAWQLCSLGLFLGAALFIGRQGGAQKYRAVVAVLVLGHFLRLVFVMRLPWGAVAKGGAPAALGVARLKALLADSRNRRFLAFCGMCSFLAMMSLPSMLLYVHRVLGYGHRAVLLASALGMLGGFVTFPLWGRLARRHGEDAVYQLGMLIQVVALGMWLVTGIGGGRGGSWVLSPLIMFLFFSVKAGEAGLFTAFAHHAYRLRPRDGGGAAYDALQPAAQWVAGALGVLVGGALMQLTVPSRAFLGLSPYLALFFVNALAFLLPLHLSASARGAPAEVQEP